MCNLNEERITNAVCLLHLAGSCSESDATFAAIAKSEFDTEEYPAGKNRFYKRIRSRRFTKYLNTSTLSGLMKDLKIFSI